MPVQQHVIPQTDSTCISTRRFGVVSCLLLHVEQRAELYWMRRGEARLCLLPVRPGPWLLICPPRVVMLPRCRIPPALYGGKNNHFHGGCVSLHVCVCASGAFEAAPMMPVPLPLLLLPSSSPSTSRQVRSRRASRRLAGANVWFTAICMAR